jgi:hypothetical protein
MHRNTWFVKTKNNHNITVYTCWSTSTLMVTNAMIKITDQDLPTVDEEGRYLWHLLLM